MEGIHIINEGSWLRRVANWLRPAPSTPAAGAALFADGFERVRNTASRPREASPPATEAVAETRNEPGPLLRELGFDPATGTIQRLPRAGAAASARACGAELSTHTRIYGDFVREKLLRCVRAFAADYLRGRDDPGTADRLENARSLAVVADLLDSTPYLEAAVRFAERKTPEPMRAALAKVHDAADLRRLERVDVAIVDLTGSGTIDERDILALEIGASSIIGPVGRELADRLRMSACIVRGMDELVESWTGGSRLSFTPGVFTGPDTWFRVERDHFALRQEKVPEQPWLTRPRSASAALRHVVDNAGAYTMDCAAAISVAWFLGKYHEIGELAGPERQDEVFDRVTPHLTIGKWHIHWSNVLERATVELDPRTDVPLPGESRYFAARDISPRGQLAGWQGENVLFYGIAHEDGPGYRRGERIWFGHPFGLTGERDIVRTLNANSFSLDADGLPALQAVIASGATGELGSKIASLEAQVRAYQTTRAEYDEFMKLNRRPLQGLRDRLSLLSHERNTGTSEYEQVREQYNELRGAMDTLDRRANQLATRAASSAESLRERAVALGDQALVAALDQLLPAPSALHDEGRVLRPYRSFQERGNGAVELL